VPSRPAGSASGCQERHRSPLTAHQPGNRSLIPQGATGRCRERVQTQRKQQTEAATAGANGEDGFEQFVNGLMAGEKAREWI